VKGVRNELLTALRETNEFLNDLEGMDASLRFLKNQAIIDRATKHIKRERRHNAKRRAGSVFHTEWCGITQSQPCDCGVQISDSSQTSL
jgi:hypothetical protein